MDIDSIKISKLRSVNTINDNDDLVVNSNNVTCKTKFSVIINNIVSRYVTPVVEAINNSISSEVSARQNADNVLANAINSEVSARESSVGAINNTLTNVTTASRDGNYGLTVSFYKLSNIKMISVVGRPSEELIAGTQYTICDVPAEFAKSVATVQGRVIANSHKSITFYNVGNKLYLTPTDNLLPASSITFTFMYL